MASFTPRAASRMLPSYLRAATRPASKIQPRALPFARRSIATKEQPRLRLGATAPNFSAKTTHGDIDFHSYIGDSWAILFSHPRDYTPVCTTELGAFAKLKKEFDARNVKMIGLSADPLEEHKKWVSDIEEVNSTSMTFPVIADESRAISWQYDMISQDDIDANTKLPFTVRSVFIIDPTKKIRLTMTYPPSVGRNTAEVLRCVDALQLGDRKGVVTPINWTVGEDVIVPPAVSTEDAKKKFGEVREVNPYLRYTNVGK